MQALKLRPYIGTYLVFFAQSKIEVNSKVRKGFATQCVSMTMFSYLLYVKYTFYFERLYILILVVLFSISFESYLVYETIFEEANNILAKQ